MEKRKFYYNQEDGTIYVRPFYDEIQDQKKNLRVVIMVTKKLILTMK